MIEEYLQPIDELLSASPAVRDVEVVRRTTKYRYHWQDKDGHLLKRWDNAPHHPSIATFPHHLHDGAEEQVVSHVAVTGLEVLQQILAAVGI